MVADVDNAAAAGFRDASAFNMVLKGKASFEAKTPVSFTADENNAVSPRGSAELSVKVNEADIGMWASGQGQER